MYTNFTIPPHAFHYELRKVSGDYIVSIFRSLAKKVDLLQEAGPFPLSEAKQYGANAVRGLTCEEENSTHKLYFVLRSAATAHEAWKSAPRYDARCVWERGALTESMEAKSGPAQILLEVDSLSHPVFGTIQ